MSQVRLAIPAGFLLLSLTIPSMSQTTDEAREVSAGSVPRPMQAPSQMAAPASVPVRTLSDEDMGDLYMARKQYREAADIYHRLFEQDSHNAVFANKLGIAMHQQEALAQALKMYQRAAKIDPRYADAQNNIGTIWYQRKKYGKAIKAYQKAITLRSDMAVLYSNLGYAYFGDRKFEEAISSFRHALALDPQLFERGSSRNGSVLQDRSVSDRGRFYYLLAKSYAEAGNTDRCLLYLRKAKEEGYKELAAAKTDPAFSALLNTPAMQEILTPRITEDGAPLP